MIMESIGIEELNNEEAKQYVGGVIFVTIIMVIGIIGNMHVLFIYTLRIRQEKEIKPFDTYTVYFVLLRF